MYKAKKKDPNVIVTIPVGGFGHGEVHPNWNKDLSCFACRLMRCPYSWNSNFSDGLAASKKRRRRGVAAAAAAPRRRGGSAAALLWRRRHRRGGAAALRRRRGAAAAATNS